MDAVKECVLHDLNSVEATNLLPVLLYLGIIFGFGCLGNGLSLFVYSNNFKPSNARCFFIFLSAMELFSSVCIVPFEIYTLVHHFETEYGNEKCRTLMFTSIWQVHASSTTLIVIALDRWRKICHPFKWQISVKLSKCLLLSLTITGFIVALPSIAVYSSNPYVVTNTSAREECYSNTTKSFVGDITVYKCSTNNDIDSLYPKLYVVAFWVMVLIGVATLSGFYSKIIQTVKRQENKFNASTTESQESKRLRKFVLQESIDQESLVTDCQHRGGKRVYQLRPISESFDEKNETVDSLVKLNNVRDDSSYGNIETDDSDSNELHMNSDFIEIEDNCKHRGNKNMVSEFKCVINDTDGIVKVKKIETGDVTSYTSQSDQSADITCDPVDLDPEDIGPCVSTSGNHGNCDDEGDTTSLPRSSWNFLKLFKLKRKKQNLKCSPKLMDKDKSASRNVTLIMFVITVSSVVSFIPYLTLSSMRALVDNVENTMTNSQYVVYQLCLRSYFLKSISNPVVYGLLDPRFRTSVKKIFKK